MEKKFIYQLGDRTYNSKESLDLGIKRHGKYYETYEKYELVESKPIKNREEELKDVKKQNIRDLKVKDLLGELSKSEQNELKLEYNCIKLYEKMGSLCETNYTKTSLSEKLKNELDRRDYKSFKKVVSDNPREVLLFSTNINYLTLVLRVHNFKIIPHRININNVDKDKLIERLKKSKKLR